MRFATSPAPFVYAGCSVPRVMFQVLLALAPVAAVQVALYGPGLLLQLAIALPTALACEALAMRLRGREARVALGDGSVLVTAALLALSVTPLAPWWLTFAGVAVAVLLGKHVYGGLGHNPFNPAMVGYAAMLVSFPLAMSRWPVPLDAANTDWPSLAIHSWHAFLGMASPADFDAWTGATALDPLRSGLAQRYTMEEIATRSALGPMSAPRRPAPGSMCTGKIAAGVSRFVEQHPWVHIDIAATAWTEKERAYTPRGATGMGTRLLAQFLRDYSTLKR